MNKGTLVISKYKTRVLIAEDSTEQSIGLMHRDPPLPYMAFPYKRAQVNKFWMLNTRAPLDIVFCLKNKIVQICKGEPFSTRMIGDDSLSDLVLEFPYGTCADTGIKIGDDICLLKEENNKYSEQF